ncbi:MAG TPA: PP0621 family protein [Rubrivivax sp.]|nr:PP0621 family protein [Rubrivivax sp.]
MKYLIVLIVIAVALWVMLRGRKTPAARPPAGAADAQAMVQCSHCGVHLPRADCVEDRSGAAYCSEAHRLAGPRAP